MESKRRMICDSIMSMLEKSPRHCLHHERGRYWVISPMLFLQQWDQSIKQNSRVNFDDLSIVSIRTLQGKVLSISIMLLQIIMGKLIVQKAIRQILIHHFVSELWRGKSLRPTHDLFLHRFFDFWTKINVLIFMQHESILKISECLLISKMFPIQMP